jgi:hypothetical protein
MYVAPEHRHPLEHDNDVHPENAEQLAYCIARLVMHYLDRRGIRTSTLIEASGACRLVEQEVHRTIGAAYYDLKALQNGKVEPLSANDVLARLFTTIQTGEAYAPRPAPSFVRETGTPVAQDIACATPPDFGQSSQPSSQDVLDHSVRSVEGGDQDPSLRQDGIGQDDSGIDGSERHFSRFGRRQPKDSESADGTTYTRGAGDYEPG